VLAAIFAHRVKSVKQVFVLAQVVNWRVVVCVLILRQTTHTVVFVTMGAPTGALVRAANVCVRRAVRNVVENALINGSITHTVEPVTMPAQLEHSVVLAVVSIHSPITHTAVSVTTRVPLANLAKTEPANKRCTSRTLPVN
jgi:hypothetical protein